MMIDSGASCSLISTEMARRIPGKRTYLEYVTLEAYDGHKLNIESSLEAVIQLLDSSPQSSILHIVKSSRKYGLFGRDLIEHNSIFNINEKLPTIKGVKARIKIKQGTVDRVCQARSVPLAMEGKVSLEIEKLVSKGVLEKCLSGGVANVCRLGKEKRRLTENVPRL